MRKRSTQEIIEATVTGSFNRQKRINQEKRRKALEKSVAQQRSADQNKKPDLATAKIRDLEARTEVSKARRDALVAKTERQKELDKRDDKNQDTKDAEARVSSKEKFASSIAGDKPKLERITSKDKSVSATGKAAMNLAKSATSIGRKVASIPTRMAARKEKQDLGKAQMKKDQAPTSGTTGQKVRYAARPVTKAVSNAATSIRRRTGRGIQTIGRKLANEDFIHEAENGKKEVKKEKIDVMKGTNKIEVNPKSLPEATMSPAQKRKDTNLKKKYDDSDMKQNMIDQYGKEEGMKVYYATIRKQAMKEAKVDKPMIFGKNLARNERRFGKKGSTEPQGFFGQKRSQAGDMTVQRGEEHKERRGVKKVKGMKTDETIPESVSGLEVQNVSDGIKFREYEFIDVVKPEPMRSPKNNITWTEEVGSDGEGLTQSEQRKGLGMSGSGIRKLKKDMVKKGNFNVKKNLAKNAPDEQHTTTTSEETVNEISFELSDKAAKLANRKVQRADNNLTKERAIKQQKKLANYATKKLRKLHQDREDFEKIYNKPDAVKEAKAPVGLMKLAATVAANNKKRKNALQIQKYIGEDKKMGRQSDEDLSAARDKFSKMDQSMPSNQFMLKRINKEINRRKKANEVKNEETIIERSGKSNQNKRLENDPIVMKYISKNFDEKNRTKAVEQKVKEDAKKSPEKLKRERQMRLMMKGKFKTNRRPRQ